MLRTREEAEGLCAGKSLRVPPTADDEQILRAHDASYLKRVASGTLTPSAVRRIGLPWSPQMVERSRRSSGATLEACRAALQHGLVVGLAGGTHHAFRDHGAGYCVFNNVAIAALAMQAEGCASKVLVVDCDVHQGDGTAAISADDPSVYTFSIHGERNFPFHKTESHLDIALPDLTGDDLYLMSLQDGLGHALSASQPELMIYLAGADPHEDDRLGRLSLRKDGRARRDHLLFSTFADLGAPAATVMAGGYAQVNGVTVDIHCNTVRTATSFSR